MVYVYDIARYVSVRSRNVRAAHAQLLANNMIARMRSHFLVLLTKRPL